MIRYLYHYLSIIIWLLCVFNINKLAPKFKFVVAICNKMNYLVCLYHWYMPIIIKKIIYKLVLKSWNTFISNFHN